MEPPLNPGPSIMDSDDNDRMFGITRPSDFIKIVPHESMPYEAFAFDLFKRKADYRLRQKDITDSQHDELMLCESSERGEQRLREFINKNGEQRLMRDIWLEERASRRRWWTITALMAVGFVAVVVLMLYFS